ncbi:MAG: hypothetical protein VX690_00005, partial [Pseudomonadota bacterium]|nr:hypothetical protein [Pseudomonadota bacterium]
MASTLIDSDRFADATDCRLLFNQGRITLRGGGGGGNVDFGDNSSTWANDGECDDPRFQGAGMASTTLAEDRFSDANDCRDLFNLGRITLISSGGGGGPVEFGDNSSTWSQNGECDDPRFQGSGMASMLIDSDRFADATDCRLLFNQGMITLRGSGGNVDFGDNSSTWANDGECDDPRFQGAGMASTTLAEDRFSDANDCRDLFNLGRITLRNEKR